MPEGAPLPDRARGEVFLDARGNGRAMRLTWHHEAEMVVLSLWRSGTCAGTFRLAKDDIDTFIDTLVDGLRDASGVHLPPAETRAQPPSQRAPVTGQGRSRARNCQPAVAAQPDGSQPSFTDWALPPAPGHQAS
ncbi:MAG: hypothetical protein ACRDQA_06235 [Nocardioidaceae bacterium]